MLSVSQSLCVDTLLKQYQTNMLRNSNSLTFEIELLAEYREPFQWFSKSVSLSKRKTSCQIHFLCSRCLYMPDCYRWTNNTHMWSLFSFLLMHKVESVSRKFWNRIQIDLLSIISYSMFHGGQTLFLAAKYPDTWNSQWNMFISIFQLK